MDAFEQVVAEIFLSNGYWVETSFKVELTKAEKALVGRASTPRWEIDVIAYKVATDELLVIECKSFLDSTGVQWAELQDGHDSRRYKLFREPVLREVVLNRLRLQLIEAGRCRDATKLRLAMVAGKIKRGDEERLGEHIRSKEWLFFGPEWLRQQLRQRAEQGYANQISSVVAKLLLRSARDEEAAGRVARRRYSDDARLTCLVVCNPKKVGSMAHKRFEAYFKPEAVTVLGARRLGILEEDLRNDVAKGYIKID